MKIVTTTDGKFAGRSIDATARPVVMPDGTEFWPDKVIALDAGGLRLANSNYSVDLTP